MARRLLSLAHLTVAEVRPPDLVAVAAEAGFGAVGLRLVPPLPDPEFVHLHEHPALLRETQHTLRATGLRVLDVEAVWLLPETRVAALRPVLDAAASLGAQHLLAVGHDPEPARLAENFGNLCSEAAKHGLQVVLEFIPYCVVGTLAAAVSLIARAGGGRAGLLVDALHLQRSGASPDDLRALDPTLLGYAQICDAPLAGPPPPERRAEAIGRRLFPGDGELPLRDLLTVLPREAPLSVEAPIAEGARISPGERARRAFAATLTTLEASQTP